MRRIMLVTTCVAMIGAALAAWPSTASAQSGLDLGAMAADFTLKTATGEPVSLYGFRGAKAAVLVFVGTDCPLGNLYIPRLNAMADEFKARGVVFLAINSNAEDSAEAVRDHAQEHDLAFPVLLDPHQAVADAMGVDRTCTAVVLDGRARLRYRGPIDDQYTYTARRAEPTRRHLEDALNTLLAGQAVEPAPDNAEVFGCPIQRASDSRNLANSDIEPAPEPKLVDVGPVTYHRDVAPVLQARCQGCHRPGQIGPFSLMSYKDARRWAASIDEVVTDGRMPPWHADPRHGHFANDRSLTDHDRSVLLAWVEQDMPEGNPADAPPPKSYPEGPWPLGEPDAVFSLPEPVEVKADGVMPYQWYRVPTNFEEDRWIRALDMRPGNREVVHHILVFVLDPNDPNFRPDEAGGNHLAGYVPGDEPAVFPEGASKRIPAGSVLLFQVHYTPIGKAVTDQSSMALYFADGPTPYRVNTKGIPNRNLTIPPGASNYKASEASFVFDEDATLVSLWPHMHLRGKAFRFTAHFPDGQSEILLSVPRYDFNWQTSYILAEPRKIPAGTRLTCEAWYDNSAENPHNPDPTALVRWGPQTFDEMMIGYFSYLTEADSRPLGGGPLAARLRERLGQRPGALAGFLGNDLTLEQKVDRAFEMLDADRDGWIAEGEFPNPAVFPRVDTDGDGRINRPEMTSALERLKRFQEATNPRPE